jgi:hypothetical protein
METVSKYVLTGLLSAIAGYQISQCSHTPTKAWLSDMNNDGTQDVVVQARNGSRAIIYGLPGSNPQDCISGQEYNKIFNPIWRAAYIQQYGQEPDYNKFVLETEWERH